MIIWKKPFTAKTFHRLTVQQIDTIFTLKWNFKIFVRKIFGKFSAKILDSNDGNFLENIKIRDFNYTYSDCEASLWNYKSVSWNGSTHFTQIERDIWFYGGTLLYNQKWKRFTTWMDMLHMIYTIWYGPYHMLHIVCMKTLS